MQGIVMAGGSGSRLRPLTCDLPKPLVPLANRPVMSYALDLLSGLNIKEVGVTLQYLPEKVESVFGRGRDFGLSLSYFIEEQPLGTAGSVKNAQGLLRDTFVVVSGDALTDFDLRPAINFHREQGALATLVLTRVAVPLEYGVVITDQEGRITKFLEKPGWSDVFSDKVNTGIYILQPEVLELIPQNSFFDFSKDLFPLLLEKGLPLYGYNLDGYWCDIGDLHQYRSAQYQLLAGNTRWPVSAAREVRPGVWLGEKAVVEKGAGIVAPSVIGAYSHICAGATVGPFSVIGESVHIAEGASVKRSIIWSGARVMRGAAVRGAVLADNVVVHPNARVFEGAAVGRGAALAEKSTVRPGVLIWPDKEVAQRQTVSDNLVWGNPVQQRQLNSPEQALALGRALANLWREESGMLIISSGAGSNEFDVLLAAAVLGVQASAVQVQVIKDIPLPAARFHAAKQGVPALHFSPGEDGQLRTVFFDADGTYLDNNKRRKLNQLLYRQEFSNVPAMLWADHNRVKPEMEVYIQEVSKLCRHAVAGKRLAVTGLRLPEWHNRLCELGHQVEFRENAAAVKEMTAQREADLAAEISGDGVNLVLYTDAGNAVDERLLQLLLCRLLLYYNGGGTLVVPVTIAERVSRMAREKTRIIKAKVNPTAYWRLLVKEEVTGRQPWLKQHQLWEDAYSQLTFICDYLSREQLTLSQALGQLPLSYQEEKVLDCPWEVKGQVIRRLLEMYPPDQVDVTDGVKVNHPRGWALALPHFSRAEYHLLGEGDTQEIARSLTGDLEEKIKFILNNSQ